MNTWKATFAITVVGMVASPVYGLPDYEPFADATASGGTSYAIGANLTGQIDAQGQQWFLAGPTAAGAVIQGGNLTISGLPAPIGNSVLMTPQNNAAARFAFGGSITNGTIYYSFALRVPDVGTTLGTGGGFIGGFNNTGAASQTGSPTVIGARPLIRATTGGFNIGLSKASSTASDFVWGASPLFTTTDTIFLVGSYTIGTLAATDDSASMWINPASNTFGAAIAPPATLTATTGADFVATGGSLQSFLLYARPNNLFPNQMVVDELRIGTSWADVTAAVIPEPGSALLTGFGLLGLISAYRLRHR